MHTDILNDDRWCRLRKYKRIKNIHFSYKNTLEKNLKPKSPNRISRKPIKTNCTTQPKKNKNKSKKKTIRMCVPLSYSPSSEKLTRNQKIFKQKQSKAQKTPRHFAFFWFQSNYIENNLYLRTKKCCGFGLNNIANLKNE